MKDIQDLKNYLQIFSDTEAVNRLVDLSRRRNDPELEAFAKAYLPHKGREVLELLKSAGYQVLPESFPKEALFKNNMYRDYQRSYGFHFLDYFSNFQVTGTDTKGILGLFPANNNLKVLHLSNISILDIDFSRYPHLTHLYLRGSFGSENFLLDLSSNTNLEVLEIEGSAAAEIRLPDSLQEFLCRKASIHDVIFPEDIRKISVLDSYFHSISEISRVDPEYLHLNNIPNDRQLENLELKGTRLVTCVISNLHLHNFRVEENQFPVLRNLYLSNTPLSSIQFIRYLNSLVLLDISDTLVSDISPLKDSKSIQEVVINGLLLRGQVRNQKRKFQEEGRFQIHG